MVSKINKLPLKDVLAAIDMNAKNVWDELSDDERKQVSFYLLNRYASAVKGSKQDKELQILKTNQYYNKNFFTLTKHKKLLWYLLCMTANDKKNIRSFEYMYDEKNQNYIITEFDSSYQMISQSGINISILNNYKNHEINFENTENKLPESSYILDIISRNQIDLFESNIFLLISIFNFS